MFVRTKTTPNSPRRSVQVVHNARDDDGRVRQKIVRHFGTAATDAEVTALKQLATQYIERERERREPTLLRPEAGLTDVQQARRGQVKPANDVRLNDLRGETVTTVGFHDVYGQLYDELGFNQVLPPVKQRASARHLKHVTLARIANPQSKRATVMTLQDRFGVEIPLPSVYAMMDRLTPTRIDRLKQRVTRAVSQLLPEAVDVLFFDCTTLYFESFDPDDLRQHGYSKDAKFKETQVVLALVVTREGLPLTYELAPGSIYEAKTLIPTLTAMQRRFEIRDATVVADRGMLSRANLKALREANFHYVVGARLKQLGDAVKQDVLAWEADAAKPLDMAVDDQRLVVAYSPSRAARDAHQRTQMVAKLKDRLTKQSANGELKAMHHRGYQRFLTIEGEATVVVDEAKIDAAAAWDGLHGVYTSHPADRLAPATILALYHDLWQVEAAFRVTKHDLQVRPVYHWKEERIKAHVAIAFMCLTLVRVLSYRVKVQQRTPMSEARIRTALQQTQVTVVRSVKDKRRYALPMPLTADAERLYKLMQIPYGDAPFEVT